MSFASRVERLKREFGRADELGVVVTVAADFLSGGALAFARVFDRSGRELAAYVRTEDETLTAFRQRARSEAQGVLGRPASSSGASGPLARRQALAGLQEAP
jgi:hypothetical protein